MEGKESLPPDFEPIKYLESEKINSMFEITKSPDWEKTIPELLNTVERYQSGKEKDFLLCHQRVFRRTDNRRVLYGAQALQAEPRCNRE